MSSKSIDPLLIAAAQAGDADALNKVLISSRQDLRRYAEYHCIVNDVEDAVQETLLVASNKIGNLRSIEKYSSWLFRIVKRECNRMRRSWRMVTNHEVDESIQTYEIAAPAEWRHKVAKMLATIPSQYRVILLLRDVEGLDLKELANNLNLSLAATKSRLHRARLVAREQLVMPGLSFDPSDLCE
ncbi:MAG: RNA polymerase sigma factor [Arenimonas sp.]